MMRVVCDVNVLISGLLFGGVPGQVYDAGTKEGKFVFLRSQLLVDELRRVLSYPKFGSRLERAGVEIDQLLYDFVNASYPALLAYIPPDAVSDPKDIHILAAAVGAKADCIISGDKRHLLTLKSYQGIPILEAERFLTLLATMDEKYQI